MSEHIIELRHISRKFEDGYSAVEDINLTVERGEFVTFLGPSGCGKTTTLRMIAGFDAPTEGEILLNGEDIGKLPPNKRPINTVFQRYALFPHMNIYDNIAFGLKMKKLSKEEITRKVKRVLALVDLEGFENRRVSTLSGGQQQRIAIARALVNEPEILLLDEPLGALDLQMRKEMQLELKHMHDELGITFIYVTHDQEEALTMSDKIVVMSRGKIHQIGTPEDIYNEPKDAFVADFIGDSNIFGGIMTGKRRVRFCGAEFECVDDVENGTIIDAVVRPEDIIVTSPEKGQIEGRVSSVIFKGVHYEITVISGKNEIVIQSTKKAETDELVGLRIEPDSIHIMIADNIVNRIETGLESDFKPAFLHGYLNFDITQLIQGAAVQDDVLVNAHGDKLDRSRIKVIVSIKPDAIKMSDDKNEGVITGHIASLVYKGDHYRYIVKTDSDEEIVVNDEYLWNKDDYVSLIIPKDAVEYTLKK